MNKSLLLLTCASGLALTMPALAQCDLDLGLNSSHRPHDFRDPQEAWLLNDVQDHHFTTEVEQLQATIANRNVPMEIHYTLMWFVNHYRALNSMANWQLKHGRPPGADYFPLECYFERALAFTPSDPTLYVIWGNYYYRKSDYERARDIYLEAEKIDPQNPEVHYNLGLLYVEMKDFDRARTHARIAYEGGFPLQGLRNKLQRLASE